MLKFASFFIQPGRLMSLGSTMVPASAAYGRLAEKSRKITLIVKENQAQARAAVIQRRVVGRVTDLQKTATTLITEGRRRLPNPKNA